VALVLGNTPAVARGSYVDPRVIERYEGGETVGDALAEKQVDVVVETVLGNGEGQDGPGEPGAGGADDGVSALDGVPRKLLSEIDAAVVDLIEGSPRRRARARRRP
jgi:hypothetical protein